MSKWLTVQRIYGILAIKQPEAAELLIELTTCAIELDKVFDTLKDEVLIQQLYRTRPDIQTLVDFKRANLHKVLGVKR